MGKSDRLAYLRERGRAVAISKRNGKVLRCPFGHVRRRTPNDRTRCYTCCNADRRIARLENRDSAVRARERDKLRKRGAYKRRGRKPLGPECKRGHLRSEHSDKRGDCIKCHRLLRKARECGMRSTF